MKKLLVSRVRFCHQILSADFCCQFLSANVFADVVEMTLTPAYTVLRQPVSCRKSFAFGRGSFSLLSRLHLLCRNFLDGMIFSRETQP